MDTVDGRVDMDKVHQLAQTNQTGGRSGIGLITSNQSQEYFAVGTTSGFEIFKIESSNQMQTTRKTQYFSESVLFIEMIYKTNFIALVLASDKNKIIVWDDFQKKNKIEMALKEPIRNLKVRKDMLVLATETKTLVFYLWQLDLVYAVDTGPNPLGLLALATNELCTNKVLVTLDNTTSELGRIRISNFGK